MSTDDDGTSLPNSMRHKRILDIAEENPDASIADIASEVPSATPDLVERVFGKYGDPAASDETSSVLEDSMASTNDSSTHEDGSETESASAEARAETEGQTTDDGGSHAPEAGRDEVPSVDELTERQRDVLAVVAARPEATQQELADHFDVTRASISRWVNDIEGFEWSERESFVTAVFDERPAPDVSLADGEPTAESAPSEAAQTAPAESPAESGDTVDTRVDIAAEVESLDERLTALEASLASESANDESVFEDPELVHKIVHACMESDRITESEELAILRELLA